MATKKPLTKAQLVSYLADKFTMTKNASQGILDELAELAGGRDQKNRFLYSAGHRKDCSGQTKSPYREESSNRCRDQDTR